MFARIFALFEKLVDPFHPTPVARPPEGLLAFYWHFVRQTGWVYVAALAAAFLVAIIEVSLFRYIGQIVDLVQASSPQTIFSDHGALLLWMAFVVVVARPLANLLHDVLVRQSITAKVGPMIRWQSYRWVIRQSVGFFNNDFAGRIATRVLQAGPAVRGSVVEVIDALWYAGIYAVSAVLLFAEADWRLAMPMVGWIVFYVLALAVFVPKIRHLSKRTAESNSALTGRVVDSYTNILTVKLFAHSDREDRYVRSALARNIDDNSRQQRHITRMAFTVSVLNSLMLGGIGGLGLWLWSVGAINLGAIALSTGLAIRITNMSGWIMWVVTGVFENVGTVQEAITTLSRPREVADAPRAPALDVRAGEIRFENVSFHYGKGSGVIEGLGLTIRPGERVGLVGPSGAGKSTLMSLLLRFYDPEGGRVLIDGQDVRGVTQDSLHAQIGVVTQDTSLMHRSVRDNIAYGRPDASEEDIRTAARRAHTDGFIDTLSDPQGRVGLDAHVGERGVKLSGGQRQRIAIARVLLKDAPILILDEATSALDSEVEAAIQANLDELMTGKTVIAIAHRLSTIARMDRLVVMDHGRIVETGTHAELVARGGLYARLWHRQSGGFIDAEEMDAAAE
ncbi:ATP-binding cassette subfamily B multidrug efflux pump [Ancylobacter aquaticus]|uniref:ATP-binding cassette subfamily B multidrug efflux pump n=1 Tax=Ancylobacter aquaticus TaxID=100 RepID=A0A4R1I4K5_ANCAQ|nr:ABC transporter ATP-binding protein [Ancylobacter aquaticus]TCK28943.1 ATP-binding cassette subfamily B multidrug efflux pump [Ancylobacter aquaticus]